MVKYPHAKTGAKGDVSWGDPVEGYIASQSRIVAWKSSWTEEPGRLLSLRSERVEYKRVQNISLS